MTLKAIAFWWRNIKQNLNELNLFPQSDQVVVIGGEITGLNAALFIKGKAWFMPVISGLQPISEKLEKPIQK